jgi:hypothetical protein
VVQPDREEVVMDVPAASDVQVMSYLHLKEHFYTNQYNSFRYHPPLIAGWTDGGHIGLQSP